MFVFVTYKSGAGEDCCLRFRSSDSFWAWLQNWKATIGTYPEKMCVYKGECVFDGS